MGIFFSKLRAQLWERKLHPLMPTYSWKSGNPQHCRNALCYCRYLDDIMWTHSEQEFRAFLRTLNSHNPSIKLKSTCHTSSVDFLDTTTFKRTHFHITHKSDIKVFFNPTDTHALLYKISFHPKPTFAALVKLLRFHRICTQQSDFRKATKILFSSLYTRG